MGGEERRILGWEEKRREENIRKREEKRILGGEEKRDEY